MTRGFAMQTLLYILRVKQKKEQESFRFLLFAFDFQSDLKILYYMDNIKLPNLEGHNKHKRNCTVLALAYSANISYSEAFELAKQAGREDNRGFRSEKLIAHANKTLKNNRFYKVKRSPITVQKFCKTYPIGRYYVRKKGHAYAIIDGIVYDKLQPKLRERILEAWSYVSK